MTSDACGEPAAGMRRGWCPTATVPMAAADGLLLRVRPPSGRLHADALRRLARICHEHGNGAVVLTRRAKLELRGIVDGAAAVSALRAAGLAPDARDAFLPDCIESPATDLDPAVAVDVGPVSRKLRETLREWGRGAELPAKVALVLDGGGLAHVGGMRGDLRFDAIAASSWRVSLAGTHATAMPLGQCAAEDIPAVAVALLERFLALRSGHEADVRRIGHALSRWGHEEFLAAANDWLTPVEAAPPERPEGAVVGYRPGAWYGVAFAFGRLDADMLRHLADASERHGDGTLRILPGRTVLLGRASAEAGAVLRSVGAIDRLDDPRLQVETCSGLGGCDRATTPTRDDARAMVASAPALLSAGTGCLLHVSGCAKSCAHSGPAPVTLTGREGRYDLSVCATPGEAPLWRGLDRPAAASRLAALERIVLRCRIDGEPVAATLARLGPVQLRELIEEEMAGA